MVNGFQDDLIETVELETAMDKYVELSDRSAKTANDRLHHGGDLIQKTYQWPVVFQLTMIAGYGLGIMLLVAWVVILATEEPKEWAFGIVPAAALLFGLFNHFAWVWVQKRFPLNLLGRVLPVTVDPNPQGMASFVTYNVDDKRCWVEHQSDLRTYLYIIGIITACSGLLLAGLTWIGSNPLGLYFVCSLLAGLVGLGMLVMSYWIKPARLILFDRERGLMIYPRSLLQPWEKDTVVNFWECEGRTLRYTSRQGLLSYNMDILHRPTQSVFAIGRYYPSEEYLKSQWNTLLWYMDKRLPLPPTPELESYQDAEWEQAMAKLKRRKGLIQTPMTISNQTLYEIGVVDEHGRPKSNQKES